MSTSAFHLALDGTLFRFGLVEHDTQAISLTKRREGESNVTDEKVIRVAKDCR
jgi:hypothetical protein